MGNIFGFLCDAHMNTYFDGEKGCRVKFPAWDLMHYAELDGCAGLYPFQQSPLCSSFDSLALINAC